MTTMTNLDPRVDVPTEQLARCESRRSFADEHRHAFPAWSGTRPGSVCMRCGRSVAWLYERRQQGPAPLLTADEWKANR